MKKSVGAKVRAVSAEIVDAVVSGGKSLDVAIAKNENRVAVGDRSLLRMLCYGCLRHHWQLQFWIDQLISKPLRKRDRVVNALVAIGLYQITKMRISDYVVLHETVEASRELRRPELAGLVNACLRRFVREDLVAVEVKDKQSKWNHPAWLIDQIREDWPDDWKDILTANNERAPMWLRTNSSRGSVDQYIKRLRAVEIEADKLDGFEDAVCLRVPQAVEDLPGFEAGDVSVQDAAAQIAAHWLLQDPNGHILDACAAPGGKSSHLLELGGDKLTLVAVDSNESRLLSVSDNFRRMGQDATIIAADASKPEGWWDGVKFDGILLDAPCSASGVIRRHPDIKILRRASDLKNLVSSQRVLLEKLWGLLSPGGILLYATCSVLAVENDEVISEFLKTHHDAVENDMLPNNNIRDLMRRKVCGFQVLPGSAGLDGFYYAALQKEKEF